MTKSVPGVAGNFAEKYPDVWKAYAAWARQRLTRSADARRKTARQTGTRHWRMLGKRVAILHPLCQEVVPLVAETYPLRDIAAAQKVFDEKGHVGKIALELN